RIELVEPRGEQSLDRRRNGDVAVTGLLDERDHLLNEQRIALGGLADALPELWIQVGEAVDHQVGLLRGEWFQQDAGGIHLPAGPGRAAIEELRPRQTEQQDRGVAREVGDVLNEVEKG